MSKNKKQKSLVGTSFLTICDEQHPRLIRGKVVAKLVHQDAFFVVLMDDMHRDRAGTVIMDTDVVKSLRSKNAKAKRVEFDRLMEKCGEVMLARNELEALCKEFDVNPSVSLLEVGSMPWFSAIDNDRDKKFSRNFDDDIPF